MGTVSTSVLETDRQELAPRSVWLEQVRGCVTLTGSPLRGDERVVPAGQEGDAVWRDAGDGHQAFRKVHGVSGTAMATVQKQRLSHGKSPK